jgi:hypothetical protein
MLVILGRLRSYSLSSLLEFYAEVPVNPEDECAAEDEEGADDIVGPRAEIPCELVSQL